MSHKTIQTIQADREARRKITGEDFTPSWLADSMTTKLFYYAKEAFQDPTKTFLDPSVGNGNLLISVLKKKLDNGHSPEQALSTIFGVDIIPQNIQECRLRLLKVLTESNIKLTIEHVKIVCRNIVCAPLLKYPNGSLDYLDLDESKTFNVNISDETAKKTLEGIISKKRLDTVSIEDDPNPFDKKDEIKSVKVKKTTESKLKPIKSKEEGSMLDEFEWN